MTNQCDITAKEIREKHYILDREIARLCNDFQRQTGARITEIQVYHPNEPSGIDENNNPVWHTHCSTRAEL